MTPPAEPPSGAPHSQQRLRLIIGTLLILVGIIAASWVLRPVGSITSVRFQVRKGISARDIARDLREDGLIHSRWSFLIWAKLYGHNSIRPGVYELSTRQSGWSIYRRLLQGPPRVRLTFPEGWTARQMAVVLETHGVTSAKDFLEIVDKEKREGFLFPDTYFFEQGLDAHVIVSRLIERFREKVPKDFKERADAMKLSFGQLVTLASIVEREARVPQERPVIAGVFYNRLRKRWLLESCATVEYALGSWKPHLTYKDLAVDSPYNTYRHRGLPPGPICNPGAAALDAAAHPAKTDMMFFVADGQGTHRFSRYYDEHLAAQAVKRKAWSVERKNP
jgi:UPF0755 protein